MGRAEQGIPRDQRHGRKAREFADAFVGEGADLRQVTDQAGDARDSGTKQGKRVVRGGRESIRSILYVVVRGICRHNADFRNFHDRLKAAGKPAKVIRVALTRKLLARLNAKARNVRKKLTLAV